MPDAATTRKMLRPLLKKRADLLMLKRHLIITPIRSIVRGIYFERCSTPECYRPFVSFAPLACLSDHSAVCFGKSELRPERHTAEEVAEMFGPHETETPMYKSWSTKDPDYPDVLLKAIETTMLPVPESVDDLAGLSRYLDSIYNWHDEPSIMFIKGWIDVMHGRFGGLSANRFINARNVLDPYSPGLADKLMEQGDGLSLQDKREILRVLHAREASAIANMKLEKHWIPTPFPAEEQGLV